MSATAPPLETLLSSVLCAFGEADILINCAGRIKRSPTLELAEDEWESILDTNLTGTFRACQVFGRHMLERGYGRIINIASLNSFVALHEVAAYAASKAAIASLTRSLAVEWSRHGVLINAIAPGVFRTELNATLLDSTPRGQELLMRTPMGRFGNTGGRSSLSCFRCRLICNRASSSGRWRLFGERCESVSDQDHL